jgi:hypothetical protein
LFSLLLLLWIGEVDIVRIVRVVIKLVNVVGIIDITVVVLGGEEGSGHISVGVIAGSGQSRTVSCGDLALMRGILRRVDCVPKCLLPRHA